MKWNYTLIVVTAVSAGVAVWLQLQKKDITFTYFYVFIGLIAVYAIVDILKTQAEDNDGEVKHSEIINEIKSLNPSGKPPDKSYQGYAIIFLLKIDELKEQRRKFLVDIGQESDRNRVSIYLDRSDNLIFRIFDDEAEPHTIKVPKKIHTFQMGTFYHFYCDYGLTENYSFMRLFINNKEFGKILFEEKLNLPEKLDNNNIKIGADIFGGNNSKFSIQMFATAHATFDSKQRHGLVTSLESYLDEISK